jgi:hypothetical protein
MKLKLCSTLLLLAVISSNTYAGFLKVGGYLGSQNGEEKVNLLLKSAPGREGSFFAVLMKDAKKISLYLVDEINANSYAMTPLEVTKDGEIGIVNDDPSLVISSAKGTNGQDVFKIMSANSSNNAGFTGFFEFEGKQSKVNWLAIDDGQYKTDDAANALQISQIDQKEREATAVFLTKEISGTFSLREKFPSMYLINQNSVLATGTKKNQIPSAIGIFLEKKGVFSKSVEMDLINPKNDTDIKTFTKKN